MSLLAPNKYPSIAKIITQIEEPINVKKTKLENFIFENPAGIDIN